MAAIVRFYLTSGLPLSNDDTWREREGWSEREGWKERRDGVDTRAC